VPPAETVCGVLAPDTVNPALFVTVVVVVSVGQPDDVEQPGPLHNAVFVIDPEADGDTCTENDTGTDAPAGTPAEIVHVIDEPDTDAWHVTPLGTVPHVAEPATNDVPAGTVSVIVTGAADVDTPLFVAVNVYTSGAV